MTLQERESRILKGARLACLLWAGCIPFFLASVTMFFPDLISAGYFLAEEYLIIPCVFFLGTVLSGRLTSAAKKSLLLSAVMVLWFAVSQMQHHVNHMGTRNFALFAVVYLLAFPYGAVVAQGDKEAGLKWIFRLYSGFTTVLVVLALMLQCDILTELLPSGICWDGTRLQLFWHPNGSACVLLLGIGCILYFLTQAEKKWEKALYGILLIGHIESAFLTNSRTTVFLLAALIAGTVFFRIWKGGWKRFLAGAAAAAALLIALICVQSVAYKLHTQIQVNKLVAQQEQAAAEQAAASEDSAEQTQPTEAKPQTQHLYVDAATGEMAIRGSGSSGQRPLSTDIGNLNGRTSIWKAAIAAVQENPFTAVWGTEYAAEEISWRNSFRVVNAHNSWFQAMVTMGIPGLLLTLVFTAAAVWNIWILLWRPEESLGRKIVALLTVCLLGGSLLECYLFTGEDISNTQNFLFFLCAGYLVQWNHAERKKIQ